MISSRGSRWLTIALLAATASAAASGVFAATGTPAHEAQASVAAPVVSVPVASLPASGVIEVYFPPWDNAERHLLGVLNSARQQILVQAFLLTSRDIAAALIAAQNRGVDVRVLADARQHADNSLSQLPSLVQAGIPVWLEDRYRNAHNKVMIVDAGSPAPILLTGSYNFTRSAQRLNAENLLIVRGNPALAEKYVQNWQRHQIAATALTRP